MCRTRARELTTRAHELTTRVRDLTTLRRATPSLLSEDAGSMGILYDMYHISGRFMTYTVYPEG